MAFSQRNPSSLRMVRRVGAPLALAAAVALALAACAPSSPTDGGGGSKSGSAATASFSGSESGKVAMNLCDSSGAYSIFVTVDGSSDKLAGVVSSSTMTFTGEDSIYTIDKSGPLPSVSSDGNSVTLNGVILKSVLDSTKTVTFAGKITCP